ncbi:hypothetical protein ACFL28_02850 [Candidatus Omnitrophota bacterium]
MIKKVIFLMENRFNLRDYQRFGIDILKQNSFSVEVWDLSFVLHPKIFNADISPDVFDHDGLILFKEMAEAQRKFLTLSNSDFVINLTGYNFLNLKIYRALSRSCSKYAIFYTNLPEPIIKRAGLVLLLHNFRKLVNFRHLDWWRQLFMKLPFKLLGARAASLALAAGEKSLNYNYPVDKNTEILYIHTLDYDLYLKEKDNPCAEKPIAVFLDEFLPLHSEFEMMGEKIPINADKYYPLLNKFFDVIEEKTGLKVVIAAHPRSTYERLPDYFNGRTCVRGKTIELIKECKLVINHCTTAISFANLFYKPAMFVTCAALDNTYQDYWTREMAKWFGKKVVFMDRPHDIDFKKELSVDKDSYEVYKRAFIKADNTEDLPFWQVVANSLKK